MASRVTLFAHPLSNAEPLPVAFRPAFIRLDPSQPGYRAIEGRRDAPSVVAFNPASEDDRLALSSWIERNLPTAMAGAPRETLPR
jgi:hypothetical protein